MKASRIGLVWISALFAIALLSVAPATSHAQSKAEQFYKKGQAAYDLGEWDKAVINYKRAFEEDPSLYALLFNIAQAYRQAGNCQQSIFFYKRYLANVPNAPNKKQVEEFIADQTEACKAKGKDPTGPIPPEPDDDDDNNVTDTKTGNDNTTRTTDDRRTGDDDDGDDDDDDDDTRVAVADDDDDDDANASISTGLTTEGPRLISAHVGLGGSFLSLGDPALATDPLLAVAVGGGYPLPVGPLTLELGGMVTYTPIPWENAQMESGTASLTALMANAGALYPIPSFPKLSVRGDAGVGVQWFGGLTEPGVVFLDQGDVATGALAALHLRVAAGVEYLVTPNITVNAFPLVFGYSPSGDLRDTISSVTRFEVLVGAGYRM